MAYNENTICKKGSRKLSHKILHDQKKPKDLHLLSAKLKIEQAMRL